MICCFLSLLPLPFNRNVRFCLVYLFVPPLPQIKTGQHGFQDPGENGLRSSQSVFSQPLENFDAQGSTKGQAAKAETTTMENPMGAPSGSNGLSPMGVSDTEGGARGSSGNDSSARSRGFTTALRESIVHNLVPTHLAEGASADLTGVVVSGADSYSCYVWKKSQYYSKIPNHPKAWPLRWCTVDANGFRFARTRGSKDGTKAMDIFNAFAVRNISSTKFL